MGVRQKIQTLVSEGTIIWNCRVSNYADDNNLYIIGKDCDKIQNLLEKDFRVLTEWFFENYMVLSQKNCHYMCIGRSTKITSYNLQIITCF